MNADKIKRIDPVSLESPPRRPVSSGNHARVDDDGRVQITVHANGLSHDEARTLRDWLRRALDGQFWMGLRFYRRLPIVPGVRLNLGTRGASVSFGHRGAWYTLGPHGRRTATLGWPGTGLRYTVTRGGQGPRQAAPPAPSAVRWLVWLLAIALVMWMLAR